MRPKLKESNCASARCAQGLGRMHCLQLCQNSGSGAALASAEPTEAAIVSSVKHLKFHSRLRTFLRDVVLVILTRLPVFGMI